MMAGTVTTEENFPSNTTEAALDEEISIRIQAGAIKSWKEKTVGGWILYTEWNVIGAND